jgi:hypothetical protein
MIIIVMRVFLFLCILMIIPTSLWNKITEFLKLMINTQTKHQNKFPVYTLNY